MIDVLNALNNEMETNLKNYCFDEWNKRLRLPCFIGEISEIATLYEDGQCEYNFMITGMDKGSYLKLLRASELLKSLYKYGKKIILKNGGAIVISYENTLTIQAETEDLKRIQINLNVKKWENK